VAIPTAQQHTPVSRTFSPAPIRDWHGSDRAGLLESERPAPEDPCAGAMQGSIEDKFQTLQAQRTSAAVDNVPETDADGKPLTKKARAALIRAAEQVQTVLACSNLTLFHILSLLETLL
jgi:hypothetical protein